MPLVEINGLRKEYRNVVAVSDLTFTLDAGDVFGFIGPNGAGKTTTIRMLATVLEPTAGTARVGGADVVTAPSDVRAQVGYMPDFFGVYDDVTVWEYLDFFAAAYHVPRHRRRAIIDDCLELVDLTGKREAFVEELSRGMKQRLCLAKTLVHDPTVLLLDEPASGLDPRARIEIKELLRELKAMGKTIFISSHILPELAEFCNKIGVIEQGSLVVSGQVDAIMSQVSGGRIYEIAFRDGLDHAAARVAEVSGVSEAKIVDGAVHATLAGPEVDAAEVLKALVERGLPVTSFSELEADLEDIFMKVTRGAVS
jgi:ABC-2 type transport system ATP-binding protein